jgi:hypothetical protein
MRPHTVEFREDESDTLCGLVGRRLGEERGEVFREQRADGSLPGENDCRAEVLLGANWRRGLPAISTLVEGAGRTIW